MGSIRNSNRRKRILKDRTIRKLVKARYNKTLEKKMQYENKILRAQQREYKDYLVNNKRKNTVTGGHELPPVRSDELVSLLHLPDSPYLVTTGGGLWSGLIKSWTGFKIAKNALEEGNNSVIEEETEKEKKYGKNIQEFQELLRLYVEDFSNIGVYRIGEEDQNKEKD